MWVPPPERGMHQTLKSKLYYDEKEGINNHRPDYGGPDCPGCIEAIQGEDD